MQNHNSAPVNSLQAGIRTAFVKVCLEINQPFCPKRVFAGYWKPACLIRRGKISRGAADCYAYLCRQCRDGCTWVEVRAKDIAAALGCELRTVWNYLKALQKAGLIERQRHGMDANTYTFLAAECLAGDARTGIEFFRSAAPAPRPQSPTVAPTPTPTPRPQQSPTPIPIRIPPPAPAPDPDLEEDPTWWITWWDDPAEPVELRPPAPVIAAGGESGLVQSRKPHQQSLVAGSTPEPKTRPPARSRNPLPLDDPYRDAVHRISGAQFFRSTDPEFWKEASRCFARLEFPPELADQVADFVLYDSPKGYNHRVIADGCRHVLGRQTAQPAQQDRSEVAHQLRLEEEYREYQDREADRYLLALPSDEREILEIAARQLNQKRFSSYHLMPSATQKDLLRRSLRESVLPKLTIQTFSQFVTPERKPPEREHEAIILTRSTTG